VFLPVSWSSSPEPSWANRAICRSASGSDHAGENNRRRRAALLPGILGAVIGTVPLCDRGSAGRSGSATPDLVASEIDDPDRAGPVEHDVLGPQVPVQHPHPVESAQAAGDLLERCLSGLEIRPLVVRHPWLSVCPSTNSVDIEKFAASRLICGRRTWGAVDAPREIHSSIMKGLRFAGSDADPIRGIFEDGDFVAVDVDGQIALAAALACICGYPGAIETWRSSSKGARKVRPKSQALPASPSARHRS